MYSFAIYDSIDAVPRADWNSLRTPDDLATDPRLIRAIEIHLADQCRCWCLLARDDNGRAVAIACLGLFTVDPAETTGPVIRKLLGRLRKIAPNAFKFRALFCGLPVPAGDSHLRISPLADPAQILSALHQTMQTLARKHRASMLVIKEFPKPCNDKIETASLRPDAPEDACGFAAPRPDSSIAPALTSLEAHDYISGDIPPAYILRRVFPDLAEYRAALRARYRHHLDDSIRRLASTHHHVEHLHGAAIAAIYTDEMHALYEAGYRKAEYRLEKVPPAFFRDLAESFGDAASMTLIRDAQGHIDGWCFALTLAGVCHALYGGAEEQPTFDAEIYFNVFYAELERAFRANVSSIRLGQTSDVFKTRLGCAAEPLCVYVKAVNPLIHRALKRFRHIAFPAIKPVEPLHVFRQGPPVSRKKGRDISQAPVLAGAPAAPVP